MDIATLAGGLFGALVIVVSILISGSLSAFVDAPSLAVVVGGTICAAMVSETMANCIGSAKVAMKALLAKVPDLHKTIEELVEMASLSRREGLAVLEGRQLDDDFLARGIRFAVDGVAPEEMRAILTGELAAMRARHKRGRGFFKFLASTAPAMGMIGTLIGLVQMLQTLDDPSSIGPAMAVALLTTFYGAILAFMIFGPIAEKLSKRSDEEGQHMALVIEGVEAIARGDHPRVIRERLAGFLAPAARQPDKKAT